MTSSAQRGMDDAKAKYASGELSDQELEWEMAFWVDVEACESCDASLCTLHYDMFYAGAIPRWADKK